MSDAVAKLMPLVEALTTDERHELVVRMDDLDGQDIPAEKLEAEWMAELNRRRNELLSGEDKGVTMEELFASMDAQRAARK